MPGPLKKGVSLVSTNSILSSLQKIAGAFVAELTVRRHMYFRFLVGQKQFRDGRQECFFTVAYSCRRHFCCIMKFTIGILFLFIFIEGTLSADCKYPAHKGPPAADKKIAPLKGHRYTIDDPTGKYQYRIGICTSATPGDEASSTSGVLQFEKDDDGNVKNTTPKEIGQFNEADIIAGTDWVYLEYAEGDKYNTHCGGEARRAVILLTCDPDATDSKPGPKVLEENTNKTGGCYYLFELAHPEICASYSPSKSTLSVGSIVLIVFFCVAAVYLIAGGLYQRFVLGAKGMEQIPNYEFWKDFGNLQADGCDFVCRTHDHRRSSPYKGLGDDQLVEEPEERDDNLLPM